MEMEIKNVELPQLTSEQKLTIRDGQVKILNIREQIRNLSDESTKTEQNVLQTVAAIGKDLNIDMNSVVFNFDILSFHNKIS